jgi:hypothetical protein
LIDGLKAGLVVLAGCYYGFGSGTIVGVYELNLVSSALGSGFFFGESYFLLGYV